MDKRAKEALNKSAAADSGSFVPTFRFENLEIHKVFLRFSNLNLEQNPSLTALADLFRASLIHCSLKSDNPDARLRQRCFCIEIDSSTLYNLYKHRYEDGK